MWVLGESAVLVFYGMPPDTRRPSVTLDLIGKKRRYHFGITDASLERLHRALVKGGWQYVR